MQSDRWLPQQTCGAGFTAEAVNADEALSILETRSDIDLLFSDIQMPGSMDGLKLAHAVYERWPSIKIILVSGQVEVSDSDKPADSLFIGKPLDVIPFASVTRSALLLGIGRKTHDQADHASPVLRDVPRRRHMP